MIAAVDTVILNHLFTLSDNNTNAKQIVSLQNSLITL